MKQSTLVLGVVASAVAAASGQSFNIDWGTLDTSPPAGYAAEGLAGVWNTFDAMPDFQRLSLVGLDGLPLNVDVMNIGFDMIDSTDIAGTSGGDEALLDDCFTAMNDPVDGCIFLRFMEPGEYRVILYGIAPDDSSLQSLMRIDQNAEGVVSIGGGWSGVMENGVTYMSQIAIVGTDGRLDVHSDGLTPPFPGTPVRSVLNGMQVVQLGQCEADLTGEGDLNFLDVSAFLGAFGNGDPAADFTGEGDFNFLDVSAFLAAFGAGCP